MNVTELVAIENGVKYHANLIELQNPLVKFICNLYGFVLVKWQDDNWLSLVTKQSFEKSIISNARTLDFFHLDFVNFPPYCKSFFSIDCMENLQEYEKYLTKMFFEASYFMINIGGNHIENVFCKCKNVEMAKMKIDLTPELLKRIEEEIHKD